jgi:hypothetical protein
MRGFLLFGLCVFAAGSAACDEKLSSITGPTPDLAPSFRSLQSSIFSNTDPSNRLACVQCHTDQGRTPTGNLVLLEGRAYQQLVGRASTTKPGAILVIPGDPDNSYLVKKLEGAPDINGLRMPRNEGPFLTEGQIRVIRRWIAEGAANN